MSCAKIPQGYKQTEAGMIPEDWNTDCFGDKTIRIGSNITPAGGEKSLKYKHLYVSSH
jgi:hypothetical protein